LNVSQHAGSGALAEPSRPEGALAAGV